MRYAVLLALMWAPLGCTTPQIKQGDTFSFPYIGLGIPPVSNLNNLKQSTSVQAHFCKIYEEIIKGDDRKMVLNELLRIASEKSGGRLFANASVTIELHPLDLQGKRPQTLELEEICGFFKATVVVTE